MTDGRRGARVYDRLLTAAGVLKRRFLWRFHHGNSRTSNWLLPTTSLAI